MSANGVKEVSEQSDEHKDNVIDKFWDTIEQKTGSIIPSYIRNVLNLSGFNSPMSVSLLDDVDLMDIEKSIQEGRMKKMIPENDKTFFGPFFTSSTFYFPAGYKKVLLKISEYIRLNGSENIMTTKIGNLQMPPKRVISRTGPVKIPGIYFSGYD